VRRADGRRPALLHAPREVRHPPCRQGAASRRRGRGARDDGRSAERRRDGGRHGRREAAAEGFTRLRRKLDAAIRARGKAGGKLVTLLQSAQVSAEISEAQAAQAIPAAVARLTSQGLSTEAVQTLAGEKLTPQAIDVLVQLGEGP
jgi:hypothetical protein